MYNMAVPLHENRQHLNNDDCVDDNREDCQIYCVQYCVS